MEKELKNFEENSTEYLKMFGDQFPTVKKMLIDDRDRHMARALKNFTTQFSNITAVIGDGHVEGIHQLLNNSNIKVQIVRLSQLRSGSMDDITKRLETPPVVLGSSTGQAQAGTGGAAIKKAQPLPHTRAHTSDKSKADPDMYEQQWRGFDEQRSQIKTSQNGREVSFSFVYSNSDDEKHPKTKKRGKTGAREPVSP